MRMMLNLELYVPIGKSRFLLQRGRKNRALKYLVIILIAFTGIKVTLLLLLVYVTCAMIYCRIQRLAGI